MHAVMVFQIAYSLERLELLVEAVLGGNGEIVRFD